MVRSAPFSLGIGSFGLGFAGPVPMMTTSARRLEARGGAGVVAMRPEFFRSHGKRPRLTALAVSAFLVATPAAAHTLWSDGTPVPAWVQNACCGPSDIHHLTPEQVRVGRDGYWVDGIQAMVPFAKTLPSQDDEYWIFYRDYPDGTQYVFCFFAPPAGF